MKLVNQVAAQWRYLNSQNGFQRRPLAILFRLLSWRILTLARMSVTVKLSAYGGINLCLPPNWRGVAKLIYVFRDEYEPELTLLKNYLSAGCNMVDVGANYGIYSLVASRLVGDTGQVIAFEPAQTSYATFEDNIRLNNIHNITARQVALSNCQGKARLYHNPDPSRNSLGGDDMNFDNETVEVTTMEKALAVLEITKVDFIKIDTEGADELVCLGAEEIIRRDHPVILYEVNPQGAEQFGLQKDGAWIFLSECGYRFFTFDNKLQYLKKLECSPDDGNVIAISGRHEKTVI